MYKRREEPAWRIVFIFLCLFLPLIYFCFNDESSFPKNVIFSSPKVESDDSAPVKSVESEMEKLLSHGTGTDSQNKIIFDKLGVGTSSLDMGRILKVRKGRRRQRRFPNDISEYNNSTISGSEEDFFTASKFSSQNAPQKLLPPKELKPVLGETVTNGIKPLFDRQHEGGDAVFALACNYPRDYYQRFVGSLRKFNFDGDIVLAVSPPHQMKRGVKNYLMKTNVIAYGFEVNCAGKDNCTLKDEFLG